MSLYSSGTIYQDEISLSFSDDLPLERIRCSQFDSGHGVYVSLFEHGSPYVVPTPVSSVSMFLVFIKPNGEEESIQTASGTLIKTGAKYLFVIPFTVTQQVGVVRAKCVVKFVGGVGGTMRISTSEFLICVDESPSNANVV